MSQDTKINTMEEIRWAVFGSRGQYKTASMFVKYLESIGKI
jgi:hypothetical protein